jgi:prepilin-type N-terminal cleavage/methylation domain-containing protein
MLKSNHHLKVLTQVVWLAVAVLIVRVLTTILLEYRFYFPPDFDQSFFLAGRRQSFAGWYSIGFYLHIVSGPIAMASVLFMLATGKSKRFRPSHRWVGRVLVVVTLLAVCPGGLIMATKTFAGPVAAWGFSIQAGVTAIAVIMTAARARQKNIRAHWAWAYRSAILLCSPVLLRLATGAFSIVDIESMNTYRFLSWASWLLPLVAYEFFRFTTRRTQMITQVKSPKVRQAKSGFTLLELLIVLAIIGILVGMLLPATRSVREASRRTQCMNNLRQLGLAALNYENALGEFPMAVGLRDSNGELSERPFSGLISLMPFIEQNNVHDQIVNATEFNQTSYPAYGPEFSNANYPPWTMQIPRLDCPSSMPAETDFGQTNYAFSVGDAARGLYRLKKPRGAFGCFVATKFSDVTDGSSNTIAMAEMGAGEPMSVQRGCVSNGEPAWLDDPSRVYDVVNDEKTDYVAGAEMIGRGSHWANGSAGFGLVNTVLPPNSPSFKVMNSEYGDGVYSAGGAHPGGITSVMVDGSSHFISTDIDAGEPCSPTLTENELEQGAATPHGVWGASGTIAGGEVVDLSDL